MEQIHTRSEREVLDAAHAAMRRRRRAEIEEFEFLVEWAALHSVDPATEPTDAPGGARHRLLAASFNQIGGEGTPKIQELSLGEIALAREAGYTATRNALADLLDLHYRLPLTWGIVSDGDANLYVARRVAKLSRHLPYAVIGVVDRAVAAAIGREGAGRVIEIAEAAVIEADPALHDTRVATEKQKRYVGLTRPDEYGLATLIARIDAGDAVFIRDTITQTAQALAVRHPDLDADELRAKALSYLARPADLMMLLLEAGQTPSSHSTSSHPALAFPADLLDALKSIDLTPLAPQRVLYLHLHQAALEGTTNAVARVEGLGPHSLAQLQTLLTGSTVIVKPVIDLHHQIRTTAYEHPATLKERSHLITGGDYWPYASSTSRNVDHDHVTPFQEGGPPDQTGSHNTGPLGRRHHRIKTHLGYQTRQVGPGHYIWQTPHGLAFQVDHQGTQRLDPLIAELHFNAPDAA